MESTVIRFTVRLSLGIKSNRQQTVHHGRLKLYSLCGSCSFRVIPCPFIHYKIPPKEPSTIRWWVKELKWKSPLTFGRSTYLCSGFLFPRTSTYIKLGKLSRFSKPQRQMNLNRSLLENQESFLTEFLGVSSEFSEEPEVWRECFIKLLSWHSLSLCVSGLKRTVCTRIIVLYPQSLFFYHPSRILL